MPRFRTAIWFYGCLTVAVLGQPTTPQAPASGTTEQTRQTPPRPRRNMSPELSAALAAGVKFEKPPAEQKKEEEEEAAQETDLREVDKPRNTIIRLPKYIVEGQRPPVFTERDIYTKKGLADLAVKRYLSNVHQGLNKYHLPSIMGGLSNEQLGMMMYEEQERLNNMQDMNEKVFLYRQTGYGENADELKDAAQSTFMRKSDFPDAPRANGR
jgi:hypothetical protein